MSDVVAGVVVLLGVAGVLSIVAIAAGRGRIGATNPRPAEHLVANPGHTALAAASTHGAASFGRRLAAALIDTAVLAMMLLALATLGFVVLVLLPALVSQAQQDAFTQAMVVPEALLVLLMAVVFAWLYSSTLHSSVWQATIGKRLLGLRVTDLQGRPISFARASARHLSTCLVWLSLGIGFLLIALPWRQGVHDLVAGTIVARRHRVVDERPIPIPAAIQSWDGGRWQPNAPDPLMPIRLRLPKRAWWLRLIAVLWFVVGLVLVVLYAADFTSAGRHLKLLDYAA